MRSILEEFAYGNIPPENQPFKQNSRYGKAVNILYETEKQLLGKLNDEEKDIFQKHVDAQIEASALNAIENFIWGYKLGVVMTAEAFITCNELIAGEE